jgi:2-oxoglutarate dehydrogenase E2 component (dihydrolipoamide succinyltransferase)
VRILAAENAVVAIGEPLAVIAEPANEATAPPAPMPQGDSAVGAVATTGASDEGAQAGQGSVAAPSAETADDGSVRTKLPRIRQTIARRMVESLQTAAQLTTVLEADVTAIALLRDRHKDAFLQRTGVKLSFLPFFVRAALDALTTHQMLNASLNDDVTEVTYHGACHLGIAVDSPGGLMVPVIRNADDLGIAGLARSVAELADRVRGKRITADHLSGGTFTITNTGSRGALFDTPIINHPQTGILGVGAVVERVMPVRDPESSLRIAVRSMAYLSLSYDHRLVDGADAARFLTAIKDRLELGFSAAELG